MLETDLVLIGPTGSGKSTLAKMLGEARYFLDHPANAALADHTIYTKGRSPEETRDEILSRL